MLGSIMMGVDALIVAVALVAAADFQPERCLHGADESVDQRARRQAAIRYLRDVNAAEARLHQQRGTYAPIADAEATGNTSVPFGFVARLTFDRWSYLISLKDVFDPCGFTLFADHDNVIYEAHPIVQGDLTQSAAAWPDGVQQRIDSGSFFSIC